MAASADSSSGGYGKSRCRVSIVGPGDNSVVIFPKGFVEPSQLAAAIADVEQMLAPDVVRIRHTIGSDWSGEPALFLRVILSDSASRPDRLHQVRSRVSAVISRQLDPLNKWGLFPYLKFRSQSEQAVLQEATWS